MLFPLWLQHAIEVYGYWVVLVAVMLESMGVPFPGETSLLAAAVYAGTGGRINIVGVIVAAAAGAILGDNIGYSVGRYGGYPLLLRILRVLHVEESKLGATKRFFARHGDKTVFASRFTSVLRTTVPFLSGVYLMPRRVFFFWNAIGGVIWAMLYGLLGFALGRHLSLLDRVLKVMGIGGGVILGVVVLGVGVMWFLRRRHSGPERTQPPAADAAAGAAEGPPSRRAAARVTERQQRVVFATSQRSCDLVVGLAAEQQRLRRQESRSRPAPQPDPSPSAAPAQAADRSDSRHEARTQSL